MTNFRLAKIMEESYDEWLHLPTYWVSNDTFKRLSGQKWAVTEVVDRLRRYCYISPDKVISDFAATLEQCMKENFSMFNEPYLIVNDMLDLLNCLEEMEDNDESDTK